MDVIFRAVEVYVDTVMNDTCHYVTVQTKSNHTILVIQGNSVSQGGNPTTFGRIHFQHRRMESSSKYDSLSSNVVIHRKQPTKLHECKIHIQGDSKGNVTIF
jgi:hypothetical protein